jgi:hypothetical protein
MIEWLWMGFGLVIGFTELSQNVTTNKDYAATVIHTSQITTHSTHKVFSVSCVFNSRHLVTDPNNALWFLTWWQIPTMPSDSMLVLTSDTFQLQLPSWTDWLPTAKISTCPAYNISDWTSQKTPFLIVVVQLLPWEHVCLRIISQSLASNGPTCHIAPSLRLFVPKSLQAYHHFYWRQTPKFSVAAVPGSVSGKLPSRCGGLPQILSATCNIGSAVFRAIRQRHLAWLQSCRLQCQWSRGTVCHWPSPVWLCKGQHFCYDSVCWGALMCTPASPAHFLTAGRTSGPPLCCFSDTIWTFLPVPMCLGGLSSCFRWQSFSASLL